MSLNNSNNIERLIRDAAELSSFEQTMAFPKINLNQNKLENPYGKKEKGIKEKIDVYQNKINEQNLVTLLNRWVEDSYPFGQVFMNKKQKSEEQVLLDCLFVDLLQNNNIQILINKNYNDEEIFISLYDRTKQEEIRTFDNNSELIDFLFEQKYIDINEKNEHYWGYISNGEITRDKVEQDYENHAAPVIYKDDIYMFLKHTGIKSKDSFYLEGLGFITQKNKIWHFISYPDIKVPIKEFDNFLKIIISHQLGDIYQYQNYSSEMLNHYVEEVKQMYESEINEKTYVQNESGDKFHVSPDVFDFKIHIHQSQIVDLDISQYEENHVVPDEQYWSFISETNEMFYEEESYGPSIDDLKSLNMFLSNQLDSVKNNHENQQHIFNENEILDNVELLSDIPQTTSDYDFDALDLIFVEEDNYDIMAANFNAYQENKSNMWTEINKVMKTKGFTVEDFFNCTTYRQFKLKPVIEEHDGEVFYKNKKYTFISNKKSISISFAIQDDNWYLYNTNQSGVGLTTMIQIMFKQINIDLDDKQAEIFKEYIENNSDFLEEEKKSRILKNELQQKVNNFDDEIDYIQKTIGFENLVNNFIHQDISFVLNVSRIEQNERNGFSKKELVIDGKHYRFKQNAWYCIEDKYQGEGIKDFIHYIDTNKSDLIIQSLNNFLHNNIVANKSFIQISNLNITEDTHIDKNLRNQDETIETSINPSVNIQAQNKYDNGLIHNMMPKYEAHNNNGDEADYQDVQYEQSKMNHNDTAISHNKMIKAETNNIIQEKDVVSPISDGVDTQTIKNDFEEKVKVKVGLLLEKKQVVEHFSMPTFLNICIKDGKPYPIKQHYQEKDKIIFGKKNPVEINVSEIASPLKFVEHIAGQYNLDLIKELKRVNESLLDNLVDLVAEKEKINLEKHQANLTISRIEQEGVEVKPEIKEILIEKNNLELKEIDVPEIKDETPEEQYNNMLGLNRNNWVKPLRPKLFDYAINQQNKVTTLYVNHVLNEYMRITKKQSWDINSNYTGDKSFYTIQPNEQSNISHVEKIVIEQFNHHASEKVSVYLKNGEIKELNSIIDCFKGMFKPLNTIALHQAISNVAENVFLNMYPMQDIVAQLGGKKVSGNSKSGNWEFGGITIGLKQTGNMQTFRIWQNQEQNVQSIYLAQLLLAYSNGLEPTKETVKNPNNKDICSFKKAKEFIKGLYLNLNNIQKSTLINQNEVTENQEMLDREKFQKLLPVQTNDKAGMVNYLVNERKINPKFVEEFSQHKIYPGLYDVKQTSWFNYLYKKNDEVTLYPVIVFASGDNFASVRGMTKESAFIKQNVPGSKSSEPFYLEPSKEYVPREDKDVAHQIVICEAAIDALSYRCLNPKAHIYSVSGLNTHFLIDAMIEADAIVKENSNIQFVYALDNIGYDENGNVIDNASRKAYFSLLGKMAEYCYEKLSDEIPELSENQNMKDNEVLMVLKNHFELKQNKEMIEILNNIPLDNANPYKNQYEIRERVGATLFKQNFIDTGRFKLESPEKDGYGIYKDWNDLLQNIVKIKQKNNPELSLEQIHENIIFEFNPELISLNDKKQLKKQQKMNLGQ